MTTKIIYTDPDGDAVFIDPADRDGDAVTFGVQTTGDGAWGVYLTVEGAETIAKALTEWAEAEKARQAAAVEREAAKLKRGEKVFAKSNSSSPYTVISDQNDDGLVDVVSLSSGILLTDIHAENLTRTKGGTA